jgi:hypothetical protein
VRSHEIERGADVGSCRNGELTRGLATLPFSRPPQRRARIGGLHLGQQVPGAGQQLAGGRDGGDLLPAASRDGRVAGGESPISRRNGSEPFTVFLFSCTVPSSVTTATWDRLR